MDGKYPEVYLSGRWSPICGPWFWDNNYGATLFCQKLNSKYSSGTVIKLTDKELKKDAVRVGRCNSNDQWLQCTGGCNDLGKGNGCAGCGAGETGSIEIKCHDGKIFNLTKPNQT
jgi:hypothetical protein